MPRIDCFDILKNNPELSAEFISITEDMPEVEQRKQAIQIVNKLLEASNESLNKVKRKVGQKLQKYNSGVSQDAIDEIIKKYSHPEQKETAQEGSVVNEDVDLTKVEYIQRYPKTHEIVFVDPSKILDRLAKDGPDYDVQNKKNQIGDRIQKAKEFILKYAKDSRWINPKTGERSEVTKAKFEPSIVQLNNGKISFEDGRHRILAAKELGIREVAIEVPKEQVNLFKKDLEAIEQPLKEYTKAGSVSVGGDVTFTQVEDKKIKDIATEANLKVGSYVRSVPTGKKNKFGNSINEYEATNPFTNKKITFKKQGDATDYVVKEIAKATTKSGREEIFKAVEQSIKETPQAGSVVGANPALKDVESTDKKQLTDNELESVVGSDVFKAVQRAESQLGEGIVDRNRMIETAKRIQKADKKDKLLPEHIFEALQYEIGFPDNWQDLRNAIKKGGIDINSEAIQRQIEVGVDLPKDIVEEFKKSERYKNATPELVKLVEQSIKESPKAGSVVGGEVELGGGIKNKVTDKGANVLPISEIDNLRSQKQTDLATGNAVSLEKDLTKNGIKEPLVITYYPNEGKAVLTDGHNRLDVAKDMGAEKLPIRIVEKYTDAPNNAKDWIPPKSVEQSIKESPKAGSVVGSDGKSVRFEIGKKLNEKEKKEVLGTLQDAYKVNKRPYTIEETPNSGRERKVYLENMYDYMPQSGITGQKVRWYITLPDGRIAHPTEVYGNVSMSEVERFAKNLEYADEANEENYNKGLKNIKDHKKVAEILSESIDDGFIKIRTLKNDYGEIIDVRIVPNEDNPKFTHSIVDYINNITDEETISDKIPYGFDVERFISEQSIKESPQSNIDEGGMVDDAGVQFMQSKRPQKTITKKAFTALTTMLKRAFPKVEFIGDKEAREIINGSDKPSYQITMPDGSKKQVQPINVDVVNGFYSPLERIINESKFEKLPAKQWIEKFAKGEEAKWTGLTDWLSQQQGSVSKADIQNYLKDNRIEIVEVVKGAEKKQVKYKQLSDMPNAIYGFAERFIETGDKKFLAEIEKEGYTIHYDNNGEVDYFTKEGKTFVADTTKFSEYQLEGEKENYKEVLVTLPRKGLSLNEEARLRELNQKAQTEISVDEYKEQTNLMKKKSQSQMVDFKSSHFDEPNILVHLRMNTRSDADGNKVLFLEEIQSDWGQTGKKEGFRESEESKKREQKKRELEEKYKQKYGDDWVMKLSQYETEELQGVFNIGREGDIPTAPFVMDTNAWTKLGLKVALKEAVKQGAEKIAWTTGEQQNDRYDLSKQVDEIGWQKNENGTYNITPKKDGSVVGTRDMMANLTLKQVEDYVGKDIAEKIQNDEGKVWEGGNVKQGKLTGQQLKVGGKGMKGFYGSPTEGSLGIVGQVAKNLFKQEPKTVNINYTDAEVAKNKLDDFTAKMKSKYNFPENGRYRVLIEKNGTEQEIKIYKELQQNYQNAEKTQSDLGVPSTQHSIDITPELKKQVSEGLPLFMRTKEGDVFGFQKGDKIYIDPSLMNADTPIHEVVGHYGMNIIDAMAKGGDARAKAVIQKGLMLLQYPEGKMVLDEIKSNSVYSNLSLREQKLEALATIIGREGANMFAEGTRKNTFASKVKDFIKSFYDYIRTKVPTLKDKTIEQIVAMDNKEFVRAIVGDAFRGEIVDNKWVKLSSEVNNIIESFTPDSVGYDNVNKEESDPVDFEYNLGKSLGINRNGYTQIIVGGKKITIRVKDHNPNSNRIQNDLDEGTDFYVNVTLENPDSRFEGADTDKELQEFAQNEPRFVSLNYANKNVTVDDVKSDIAKEIQKLISPLSSEQQEIVSISDKEKTDLQKAEDNLKNAWRNFLNNGIAFDGMAEAEKERQLIVALLGYLKAKGIDIAKGIGNEVREFIKNKFVGVTDEMIDVAQGRMLTDYQKLYDTHMTPKNKEILDDMVRQVKSGEMSFEDFINTIDNIVPNERIKNVFISYVNEQIDPLDGYVAVDEEIEETPESPKAETSKEEERAFIGGLLARPINNKNFPNIVGGNKTDEDVLKRITAVTQEDVQDRKVMVDTSYVRVALEDIKEIALQNANALYMQFGEDWQTKVMDYLSDYLNAANPAQAIGILNVISTDVQQKIEKSQSPAERTKLFKLQDKADELSILFASQASLGINARKILRQFAQGGNMSKLVLDKILTEDTIQTIEEINKIMSVAPSNDELNNATMPIVEPQTAKSRLQKIKENIKQVVSPKSKKRGKISESDINNLERKAEEERKRQGVKTKMSREQIIEMLKEESKKC